MKHRSFLGIVFAMVCLFSTVIPVALSSAEVIIVSSCMFEDMLKDVHVVGEIQNVGDTTVAEMSVKAMFYDAADRLIGSGFDYFAIAPGSCVCARPQSIVLLPSARAPFDIELMFEKTLPEVDHYSLTVSFHDSPVSKPSNLEITSTDFYVVRYPRSIGSFINIKPVYVTINSVVNGTITNLGSEISESTQVWVTFYDVNGIVCFVEKALVDQPNIPPSESTKFTAEAFQAPQQLSKIASYRVTVQSSQYTVSSEKVGLAPVTPTDEPETQCNILNFALEIFVILSLSMSLLIVIIIVIKKHGMFKTNHTDPSSRIIFSF